MLKRGPAHARPAYRLRHVLLLFVVLPLLVVVAAGWLLVLDRVERLAEERMQEEIALVARTLSVPLAETLRQGSIGRVYESLLAVDELNRVYAAFVYHPDGSVVAALGTPPAERIDEISRIAAGGANTGAYGERGGRRVFSYFVPLPGVGGQVAGVLEVTRRQRDIETYVTQTRIQTTLMLVGFASVLVGLVIWGHHRALGRHVERLADDMAAVMHGDRQHRARTTGFQEVGVLASALNDMLDGIAASQQELDNRRAAQMELALRLHQSERIAATGALAAGVAHELGAPLSVVRGRAQRLLRATGLDATTTDGILDIQRQVSRMEATIRHLLEFCGHHRRSSCRRVAVVDVVCRVVQAEDAGAVDVRVEAEDVGVMWLDVTPFEIALSNLVRNAVQAAAGVVTVRVSAAVGELRICVGDDGPGVPEDLRPRIWDPFFTTKPTAHGTGLGLSLAHRAVGDMGGQVSVSTSPLGGARFELVLPEPRA